MLFGLFLFMITVIIIYLAGVVLSYLMQRTEMLSEKEPYTIGDRLMIYTFSLLSFILIAIILVRAWVKQISLTGYWDEPVEKPVIVEKISNKKSVLN